MRSQEVRRWRSYDLQRERNEYHGITIERAQRILDVLGALVVVKVTEPQPKAS